MDSLHRLTIDRAVKFRANKQHVLRPVRWIPRRIGRSSSAPDLLGWTEHRLYDGDILYEPHDGEDESILGSVKGGNAHRFLEGLKKTDNHWTQELKRTRSRLTEDYDSKTGEFKSTPTPVNVDDVNMKVDEESAQRENCCSFFTQLPVAPKTRNLAYDLYHVFNYSTTQIGWVVNVFVMLVILISIVDLIVGSFPGIRRDKDTDGLSTTTPLKSVA